MVFGVNLAEFSICWHDTIRFRLEIS